MRVARELGLPAGTVKARLARGRAALALVAEGTTWPAMVFTDGTLWALHTSEAKLSRVAPGR